jgi:NAD(P)H-dependent FMN reductase
MPRLTIVIASTRAGRAGRPIAEWFADRARMHGAFGIHVADGYPAALKNAVDYAADGRRRRRVLDGASTDAS